MFFWLKIKSVAEPGEQHSSNAQPVAPGDRPMNSGLKVSSGRQGLHLSSLCRPANRMPVQVEVLGAEEQIYRLARVARYVLGISAQLDSKSQPEMKWAIYDHAADSPSTTLAHC